MRTKPLPIVVILVYFACVALALASPLRGGPAPVTLQVKSSDFASGETIPKQFSCEGADISPALSWNDPPSGTTSFALIVDDPDAPVGNWVHWVVYNLPASLRALPQNFAKTEQSSDGTRQGLNDFKKIGYNGPCPPTGKPHRYFFKLYALDSKLNLNSRASKKELEAAMQGHILAQGEYMGRYAR